MVRGRTWHAWGASAPSMIVTGDRRRGIVPDPPASATCRGVEQLIQLFRRSAAPPLTAVGPAHGTEQGGAGPGGGGYHPPSHGLMADGGDTPPHLSSHASMCGRRSRRGRARCTASTDRAGSERATQGSRHRLSSAPLGALTGGGGAHRASPRLRIFADSGRIATRSGRGRHGLGRGGLLCSPLPPDCGRGG